MLPIYTVISVEQENLIGGSTKPAIIRAVDKNGKSKKLVVKLFKQKHLLQYYPIHKEVYASILASYFGLNTPPPCLIYIKENTIKALNETGYYGDTYDLQAGYFFATEYIENAKNYTPTFVETALNDYGIDSIFAFDMFIRNTDRRTDKPNLFFINDSICLIDHELTLAISQKLATYLDKQLFKYISQKHLFYPYLKTNKTVHLFSEFEFYLQSLSPNILLQPYQNQLNTILTIADTDNQNEWINKEMANFQLLQNYLSDCSRSSIKFIAHLNNLFQ